MSKKSILKTFGAGLVAGALIGVRVAISLYEFGYDTRIRVENGDKAAERLDDTIRAIKVQIGESSPLKKMANN